MAQVKNLTEMTVAAQDTIYPGGRHLSPEYSQASQHLNHGRGSVLVGSVHISHLREDRCHGARGGTWCHTDAF